MFSIFDEESQTRENLRNLREFGSRYIRPRIGTFSLVQFLHVLGVLLLLAPPLIVRDVLDSVIPQENYRLLVIYSLSIAGIYALFAIIAGLKEYWGHEVAQRATARLRNDLYSHFQKLSMSFHDRKKTGELLSRVVDDINVIQEVIHHGPEAIILATVMVTGSTGVLLYLNWRLGLVALAIIPVLLIYASKMCSRMWDRFREVRKRKASLSDEVEENLAGIQIIKAYGAEGREAEAVANENESHYQSRMSVIKWVSLLFPGAMFINNVGLAAVLLYGGALTMQGAVKIGTLAAFILYLRRFLQPIIRLVIMLEQGGRFFASLERFSEYMAVEPDIQDRPDANNLTDVEGEVAFEDIYFKYEDEAVLRGVNLVARPGQTVALVGPSGAGKTTIMRLIPRFYEPYKGTIRIDGTDVRDVRLHSLRSQMAMVMQDDFLFSGTVTENIGYSKPDATQKEIIEAARVANADVFVEEMADEYETEIGKRGVKLSEGQRQRISIARAVLKDPRILLLDEATSSVDPETERLIQRALERLCEGRTTFAIAHRLSTIFRADKILFVKDGQITEWGTHQELIDSNGEYARFFEIQFGEMQSV